MIALPLSWATFQDYTLTLTEILVWPLTVVLGLLIVGMVTVQTVGVTCGYRLAREEILSERYKQPAP